MPWVDRTGPHTVPKEIFARIFVFSVHFAMLRAFQAILRGQSGCGQGGAPSCILIGDTGRKKIAFSAEVTLNWTKIGEIGSQNRVIACGFGFVRANFARKNRVSGAGMVLEALFFPSVPPLECARGAPPAHTNPRWQFYFWTIT